MTTKRKYLRRREIVEEIELDPNELMTIADAARELGLHPNTISTHIDTGRLESFEDPEAPPRQGRRLVLRREIEEMRRQQEQAAAPWAPMLGLDACQECGTTERPHYAKGLCEPCYKRQWRRERKEES